MSSEKRMEEQKLVKQRNSQQIQIQSVSWSPVTSDRKILKEITCQFESGKFYGILGPNGSGKTSLMRHVLRLLPVKAGKITLNQVDISKMKHNEFAKEVSLVPQKTSIDAEFTVYDIVAMGRTPYQKQFQGLTSKDEQIIAQALEVTRCTSLKDQYFNQLSGGEAQRVLVARTIAQDTPWLVLDEPIASLDIKYQVEVMDTLRRLNKEENKTVIAILHDLNLAARYCDEIVLMKNGTVFDSGTVDDVLTVDNLRKVYEIDFYVQTNQKTGKSYFIPDSKLNY